MPKVPLAGGFYEDSALQFDTQRCVNMFPVGTEVDNGKSTAKLKNTPGIKIFSTEAVKAGGDMVVYGMHVTSEGRLFAASIVDNYGTFRFVLSEWLVDGSKVDRGGIAMSGSPDVETVKIADNGTVINFVTGYESYFYNLDTDTLTEITDPDYPASVFDVAYKDTYFVWLDSDTNRFYISSSNATDPTDCINALDFGTVESNPDDLAGIIGIGNEVAIFGTRTIEFFYNSGNVDFPFSRNSGVTQEIGTTSIRSISKINNEVYFLGNNDAGYGIVYRMNGYQPQRISTHAIEIQLRKSDDLSDVIAFTYQDEGSYFYCLSVIDIDKTFCYDSSSGLWHERLQLDGVNEVRYPVIYQAFAFNKNIIANNETPTDELGNGLQVLYEFDNNYYKDDVLTGIIDGPSPPFPPVYDSIDIQRQRILPHFTQENKNLQYNYFEMDIQKGVGNVDDTDPEVTLNISRDGGMTYGNDIVMKMGAASAYMGRVREDMLGIARDAVFKITSDAPVRQEWFTAYIDFEVMNE